MSTKFFRQKRYNYWSTSLLFVGMVSLLLLISFLIFGLEGVIWAAVIMTTALVLGSRIPTHYIMRFAKARKLNQYEAPQLYDVVRQLAYHAKLDKVPKVYFIPSNAINAFATGHKGDAAIAVTNGLMQQLSLREMTGVLAHEMSHLVNNDMRFQGIVSIMGRIIRFFSFVGQLLFLLNFPLMIMGIETVSWLGLVLLIIAPMLSNIMILAISRTREFEADLNAAQLTGDPDGLANALQKLHVLNRMSRNYALQRALPSWLSTHPELPERIRRLRELAPRYSLNINFPQVNWV